MKFESIYIIDEMFARLHSLSDLKVREGAILNKDYIQQNNKALIKCMIKLYRGMVEDKSIYFYEFNIEYEILAYEKNKAVQIAENLMDILSVEMIAKKTALSIEEVEKLKKIRITFVNY